MSRRSSVLPVVASGATTAIKLLVATLAFIGAYAGVEATRSVPARPPAQTLTLRPAPAAAELPARPAHTGPARTDTVDVTVTPGASCDHRVVARTLLVNPDPSGTLLYGWRMQRWSVTADAWKTYLTANSGFTGDHRTAEWETRVVANPGWYRFELTTRGGDPVRSERFRVSC